MIPSIHNQDNPQLRLNTHRLTHSFPQVSIYNDPLYKVVLANGEDEAVEPFPRLFRIFYQEFLRSFQLWRAPCLIQWTNNRQRVVRIATKFVQRGLCTEYCSPYCHREILQTIILHCNLCSEDEQCLICEFTTQNLSILFRMESARISAFNTLVSATLHSIIFEACGNPHHMEYIKDLVLHLIQFIQNREFAPEIREGVVDRRTFLIWAKAFLEGRLGEYYQRPFNNAFLQHYLPADHDTFLLRAFPNLRDQDFPPSRSNILQV